MVKKIIVAAVAVAALAFAGYMLWNNFFKH